MTPLRSGGQTVGLEVEVDGERCMGSGNCAYWLPDVFELDDDGYAHVVDPTAASEEDVVLAAQRCPIHAISVLRDGQVLV